MEEHVGRDTERKLNVLYIDDDADDREIFADALEKLNLSYNLTTKNSCMELIEMLDEGYAVDIIFLDVNMPVKDGKQCLREIKAHEKYKNIPVVVFSVSKSEPDIDEVYGLGAHYHVIKPYARINYVASLKMVFDLDWRKKQPIPPRDEFVINYCYVT